MKHNLTTTLACLTVLSAGMTAHAISVDEENVARIYAVSTLSGNRGVYTLSTSGEYTATKLSGSTYVQYDFGGSGGTFVSKDKVYGTKDSGYTVYAGYATSEGNGEDGPWSHIAWSYRNGPAGSSYTYEVVATDMTYDPVGGKIYGWFKADSYGTKFHLCIYDGEAVTVTPVGPNSDVMITALAADAKGELWGIAGASGALYSIDKSNGTMVKKGTLTATAGDAGQSAVIDPYTGALYWSAVQNSMMAALYKVDVSACSVEKVYDFPMGQRFNAFFIPAQESRKGAPAKVEDLAGAYGGNGSDVEVTFTAPTSTYGGQELGGNLTYELSLDDAVLEKGTMKAGASFAKTYSMSEGLHSLSVVMTNNQGPGPKATATVYVGDDTPGAVIGLTAEVIGEHKVKLAWNKPVGELGGYVDDSKLSYTIMRIPDFEEVATGWTETTFTDEVPDGYVSEYSYTVTTVYDGVEGKAESTELMLVGSPYDIPYTQDFNSARSLSDITYKVIDLDQNTPTWQLSEADGNKFISVTGGNDSQRRDYIFSAPIRFKAGVEYTLTFKIANSDPGAMTQLRIFLSKSRSANDADFVKPYISANFNHQPNAANAGQFVEKSFTFTLEESGTFSLGFYDFSYYWLTNTISIDDISITSNGEESDPVHDLAIVNVEAPALVKLNSNNEILVTVANNGTEPESVTLNLECDGVVVDALTADNTLAPGKTSEHIFALPWTPASPVKASYRVLLDVENDANDADNLFGPFEIEFEQASELAEFEAGRPTVLTSASGVVVTGAAGQSASVFSADGRLLASTDDCGAEWTVALRPGVYVVKVGLFTVKKSIK